jgi:hypothetical protein
MARIQHMVLLKFKPGVSDEVVADVFAQVANLQEIIPGILHFGGGPYASDEGLNQGYDHGFLITFVDAAARDNYLVHPEHEKVKQTILRQVDSAIAFDFED